MKDKTRAVGIDPGTKSWDMVCLCGEDVIWKKSIPTEFIKGRIHEIIDEIEELRPDAVSAPSGYGLPLAKIRDVDETRYFELILKKQDEKTVMGLLNFLKELKKTELNAYILPSVKHLQTVPMHRKINKIDMGTPDKICSVAYSMYMLKEEHGIPFNKSSFIHCEIGHGFNAFIAVDNGKIVDGIGGSISSGGNLCSGMLDFELAYLRGTVNEIGNKRTGKSDMIQGGYKSITLPSKIKKNYLKEAIIRDIYRLLPDMTPEFIVFSMRNKCSRTEATNTPKTETITGPTMEAINEIRDRGFKTITLPFKSHQAGDVKMAGDIKTAPIGGAMIANGLAGGKFKELVETLEIRNSKGSVFDFIYPPLEIQQEIYNL